jgi:hypothetical protein
MLEGTVHRAWRRLSSCVMVCDNDLEQEWSQDREDDGNTGDTRMHR